MIKLLRANFARVIKSATFWIFIALYALYPIMVAIIESESFERISSDKMLSLNYGVEWFPLQGILIALICSIIFSADFHNGTLKNKIIIGQSKTNIYVANLLTMMIISLALSVIYILIFFAVGMPILGKFKYSASTLIWIIVNGSLVLTTYSSIMMLIVMTSKNAFASLIISLLVLTASALLCYFMDYIVSIPEYIPISYENELGEIFWKQIPNEDVPSKAVKSFCRLLTDILPSGQSFQISSIGYTHGWIMGIYSRNDIHNWQMALYSLVIIGATTGTGMAIFKKANIK